MNINRQSSPEVNIFQEQGSWRWTTKICQGIWPRKNYTSTFLCNYFKWRQNISRALYWLRKCSYTSAVSYHLFHLRTSKGFICFHSFRKGKRHLDKLEAKWTNPYELVYSYCLAKIAQSLNSTQPHISSFTCQTASLEVFKNFMWLFRNTKTNPDPTDCQRSV